MRPLPISRAEFASFFQKVRPSPGWPPRIGVANSGGPDSTCLLFLIQRYIEDSTPSQTSSPESIFSLSVDHALQASSPSMAMQGARTATGLRIPHTTVPIPWGTPPFPPLPDQTQSFENIARLARYHLFWKWMRAEAIGVLAIGHHADDQVETALMRLGRKSSELGGRGMLGCRLWGMGQRNDLEWVGHEGMTKWIVRPLLEFPKDRILATCEENELSYVIDPTNFQPDATLRNALRTLISSKARGEEPLDIAKLPSKFQEHLSAINETIGAFSHLSIDLDSPPERLRAAVKSIDIFADDVENQATSQLQNVRLPSPAGTFILSTRAIQVITNPLLRRAMILRILRYISFHPWGSLQSQARRSKHSLDRIVSKVWDPNPFGSSSLGTFVAGGGVLWTPVVVDVTESTPNFLDAGGRIKKPSLRAIQSQGVPLGKGVVGWMATRQPPHRPDKMMQYGLEDTLNVDISLDIRKGLKAWDGGKGEGPAIVEVLWDCRFLIRFDLTKMPEGIATLMLDDRCDKSRLVIRWWAKYYYPKVVIAPPGTTLAWSETEKDKEHVLHSTLDSHRPSMLLGLGQARKEKSVSSDTLKLYRAGQGKGNTPLVTSDWIHTSWIRILDTC